MVVHWPPNLIRIRNIFVGIGTKSLRWCYCLDVTAQAGHLDIVKYLAGEKAACVDAAQEDGGTALLSAAHAGHLDIVKYLAGERAACVDAAQGDDITPLMSAAHKGHLDVVKYLAGEKAASVDAAQEDGGTALLSAARAYQYEQLQA